MSRAAKVVLRGFLCCAVCAAVFIALLGCGAAGNGKKTIVCTAFAQYDWTMNILGENADKFNIKYLGETGVDTHSYQASVADIAAVTNASLFIYSGAETWGKDAIALSTPDKLTALSLLDAAGVEGDGHEDGHEGHDHEQDEHVWLSINYAKVIVGKIADAICGLDADNETLYRKNAAAYIAELDKLDIAYRTAVAAAEKDTLMFCDRFPFLYLCEDYGISYYAAFPGCSAETEASFATILTLVKKADELDIDCLLVIENSRSDIAETVRQNTAKKNQRILSLNSCQSVSKKQIQDGATYLSIMTENLAVIKTALG